MLCRAIRTDPSGPLVDLQKAMAKDVFENASPRLFAERPVEEVGPASMLLANVRSSTNESSADVAAIDARTMMNDAATLVGCAWQLLAGPHLDTYDELVRLRPNRQGDARRFTFCRIVSKNDVRVDPGVIVEDFRQPPVDDWDLFLEKRRRIRHVDTVGSGGAMLRHAFNEAH